MDVTWRIASRTTRLARFVATASGTFKAALTKQGSALHSISNRASRKLKGGQTSKSLVFSVGLPWPVEWLGGKEELVGVIVIWSSAKRSGRGFSKSFLFILSQFSVKSSIWQSAEIQWEFWIDLKPNRWQVQLRCSYWLWSCLQTADRGWKWSIFGGLVTWATNCKHWLAENCSFDLKPTFWTVKRRTIAVLEEGENPFHFVDVTLVQVGAIFYPNFASKQGGGDLTPPRIVWKMNRFGDWGFIVNSSNRPSFIEIGEMACVAPAWSSPRHTLIPLSQWVIAQSFCLKSANFGSLRIHKQSRKELEIHLEACRRRFREFGAILSGSYQSPPCSKPWVIFPI